MIDEKPLDPSTILTVIHAVEKVTKEAEQEITINICVHQLDRIVVNVVWTDPKWWSKFFFRPRGMHMLMSFTGWVG